MTIPAHSPARAEPPSAWFVSAPDVETGWFDAIPGERVRIHVAGRAVGGRYTMIESVSEPGTGAPLHAHREDEVFHVLEGALTFRCAEDRFEAGPGVVVVIPAGVRHSWSNFGGTQARAMVTLTPGGFDELIVRVAGLDPDEIARVALDYGAVVLGPPMARD